MSTDNAHSRFAADQDPDATLSPLESEVLEEYALLRDNLDRLSSHLAHLSGSEATAAGGAGTTTTVSATTPTASIGRSTADGSSGTITTAAAAPAISDALRALERKTSLVCTALKASVYGILLQQQLLPGAEEGE